MGARPVQEPALRRPGGIIIVDRRGPVINFVNCSLDVAI